MFDEMPDLQYSLTDYLPLDHEADCHLCDADGMVVTCVDDVCRGVGFCIHGDGMAICRCQVSADVGR